VINDTSEPVRVSAVRSLGEWLDADPEVRGVLRQVVSNDSPKDVRDAAAQMLQSRGRFEVADGTVAGSG